MEIQKININDINVAEYNPRLISNDEYLRLKNSIDTFGFVDPIIINLKNNRIIGGHQRYDILLEKYEKGEDIEELNMITLGNIGWVFLDEIIDISDEDHEKALNLALNKISGEWDEGKLKDMLVDLQSTGLDTDLTGFDHDDIELITLSDSNFENIFDIEEYDDDDDDDEKLPSDADIDAEGEVQNQTYTISIVFSEKEEANNFLEILECDRKIEKTTLVVDEREIKYGNSE